MAAWTRKWPPGRLAGRRAAHFRLVTPGRHNGYGRPSPPTLPPTPPHPLPAPLLRRPPRFLPRATAPGGPGPRTVRRGLLSPAGWTTSGPIRMNQQQLGWCASILTPLPLLLPVSVCLPACLPACLSAGLAISRLGQLPAIDACRPRARPGGGPELCQRRVAAEPPNKLKACNKVLKT